MSVDKCIFFKDQKGLTLVEGLIGTALVATMLICVLGTFLVSRYSVPHARHRIIAMNLIKERMEEETAAGFNGGSYATPPFNAAANPASPDPITITLDNILYTMTPETSSVTTIGAGATAISYKQIGFTVSWSENSVQYTERAATYVSNHPLS